MKLKASSQERQRLMGKANLIGPVPLFWWFDKFVYGDFRGHRISTYPKKITAIKYKAQNGHTNARIIWAAYQADRLRGLVK